MAWDEDVFAVLDELEHRAEAAYDRERLPELADRGRAEYASVTLASRLMASVDSDVVLDVQGVGPLEGRLRRVAAEWCLLRGPGQDWVVRTDAVRVLRGLSDRSVPEVAWSPLARLGFASALRRLADRGERCVVRLRDGAAHDVVLRRVGADFLEADEGSGRLLVPFDAVAAVQSRDA